VVTGMHVRGKPGIVGVVFWIKRTSREDNDDTMQQKTLTHSKRHGDWPNCRPTNHPPAKLRADVSWSIWPFLHK
jgi:hypothetical protein